jgi:hypothetical protein
MENNNNTIILRDVPVGVTVEEIHAVFIAAFEGDDNIPMITNIYPDVGQCWYVFSNMYIYMCLFADKHMQSSDRSVALFHNTVFGFVFFVTGLLHSLCHHDLN